MALPSDLRSEFGVLYPEKIQGWPFVSKTAVVRVRFKSLFSCGVQWSGTNNRIRSRDDSVRAVYQIQTQSRGRSQGVHIASPLDLHDAMIVLE